ncbi:ABC transporter ATP-binding protein [Inediibacterium massiliense]|uniref:ABC transporter ATP-binding protein n=1 Tax=Inediibacterium massiliense TaxID=1658111 RepID=UPI0006B4EB15|nr:dipeptide/oligopeptide/nickel ABC transporter ATP-binding protein [Inediibacterium massiliense]
MLKVSKIYKNYDHEVLKGISLSLKKGYCYTLVGKSGCGKSTLSRIICGMEKPDKGNVIYNGKDIYSIKKREFKKIQKDVQIVFQDAYSSLNPRWSIYKSIKEPIDNYQKLRKESCKNKINELIKIVGLDTNVLKRRPNELSGGQLKRVCIARAISCDPKLIIFDESVSGLDMETKQGILNLLIDLQKKINSTYLMITHDMEVAQAISDIIFKMENGKISLI